MQYPEKLRTDSLCPEPRRAWCGALLAIFVYTSHPGSQTLTKGLLISSLSPLISVCLVPLSCHPSAGRLGQCGSPSLHSSAFCQITRSKLRVCSSCFISLPLFLTHPIFFICKVMFLPTWSMCTNICFTLLVLQCYSLMLSYSRFALLICPLLTQCLRLSLV